MRKIEFPQIEAQTCESCKGTGKLPPELAPPVVCKSCGTPNQQTQTPCSQCKEGKIEPITPLQLLGMTLNPTKEEVDAGGGIGMVEMAANYPVAKALKEHEDGVMWLTEEQWKHLLTRLDKTKWRLWQEDIWLICQAVKEAEDVEAEKVAHLNRPQRRSLS